MVAPEGRLGRGRSTRIVYVLRGSFLARASGGRIKSATIASALAAVGDLTIIDLSREAYPGPRFPAGQRFALPHGGEASFYSSVRAGNPWIERLSKIKGAPLDPRRLWRTRAARRRAALAVIDSLSPDVLVVDHPLMAPLALEASVPTRVLHTHNVESRLAAANAERTGKLRFRRRARLVERIERELLPRFDQVWGVREEDLEVYRTLGVKRAVLAPNVIADAVFRRPISVGLPGTVALVGSLAYPPNAAAAGYLVQLGERLAAENRALRIAIVGNQPSPDLVRAARVHAWLELPGYVADLHAYLDRIAVIAVPLAWGAGTKLKVLEGLALAKPVVTTAVGAEGIRIEDGVHALIRELGPAFDAALLATAADPAAHRDMASRGRELAFACYSQTALTATIAEALAAGPHAAPRGVSRERGY